MKAKSILIAAGVGAALYFTLRAAKANATQDTASVTATAKGGANVTPIKTSSIAKAGGTIVDSIAGLASFATRATRSALSAVIQVSEANKLQPFGNAQSANAAYTAPLRPDYRPSALASIQ